MLKKYLTLKIMLNYLDDGLSFGDIAKKIEKDTGKKFTRQWVHKVYQQYKKEYPKEFENIRGNNLPPKEELKKMISEGKHLCEICKAFNISYATLKKVMKKYKINKQSLKETLNSRTLSNLVAQFSDKEIADKYHCSVNTVISLRQSNKISRKSVERV